MISYPKIFERALRLDSGLDRIMRGDLDTISSRASSLSVVKDDLSLLLKLETAFYFAHVIDNRTRLYVKNIPINYQIDRFTRVCINFQKTQKVLD